jgi:hypothetical protein
MSPLTFCFALHRPTTPGIAAPLYIDSVSGNTPWDFSTEIPSSQNRDESNDDETQRKN